MNKCCAHFVVVSVDDRGDYHHKNCPKFYTEKNPYLFYYEDAIGYFAPSPNNIENILSFDSIDDDEEVEIKFRRKDMTDYEFKNLPEE